MVMAAKAKSMKTTVGGLVVALGLIFSALGKVMNGEPLEMTEVSLIVAALGAAWQGFVSRDDDVTSEGAKRPKSGPGTSALGRYLLVCGLALSVPACSTFQGHAETDDVAPLVNIVASEVESYVASDTQATDTVKMARLSLATSAKSAVAGETVDTRDPVIQATMEALAGVHRAYVDGDPALDAWQREQRGRSSEILRRLFGVEIR